MKSNDLESRVARGGLWVLFGKLTTLALSVAFSGILARLLTPGDFGSFVMIFSILSLAVVVAQMGLGGAAVRLVAESVELGRSARPRSIAKVVLTCGWLGSVGTALFLGTGPGEWISSRLFGSQAITGALPLIGIWVVAATLSGLVSELFRGFIDFRSATLFGGLLSGSILTGGLATCWLLRGTATLGQVMMIGLSSSAASALVAVHMLRRRCLGSSGANDPISPRLVFSIACPLLAVELASLALRQGDVWVVGVSQSPEVLGLYGAAARLIAAIGVPLWIVNRVASPFVAGLAATGESGRLERLLRGLTTMMAVPVLLASLAFVLWGDAILGAVFGESFRVGARFLAALTAGHAAAAVLGPCEATLSMSGHHKILMKIQLTTLFLTLVSMILVVEPLGAFGVAVVMSLGLGLKSLLAWTAVHKLIGIWTHCGAIRAADLGALVAVLRPGPKIESG